MQTPDSSTNKDVTSPRRRRWAGLGVLAALLLVLALTPPLLNVNRLQRRISASMSDALGRPVHLDRVTMHLLPLPGFTLENLVVNEDPAFGYEPVIRANTVEVTLRPSSLWRRQVELSTIRFVEPSLNLVRNAQGRWNLQSLLMHAASVNSAPTAQTTHGPTPRFPYIEATDGRVNVKSGDDKKPFSLTEADFALWLPTPDAWHIRLEAKPSRTDENISDPGVIKLEGSLQRAAAMADVPVDLTANWQGAPLGQASRLLTGEDANWRGRLNVDATLTGKLGSAALHTRVHLDDLRRADFVPARTLELTVDCSGTEDVTAALLLAPSCRLNAPDGDGWLLSATAGRVDLSRLNAAGAPNAALGLRLTTSGLPEHWLLDWARLFSQRIPAGETADGTLAGSFTLMPGTPPFWAGTMRSGDKPPASPDAPQYLLTADAGGATLEPVNLLPSGKQPPLLLSGHATAAGLTLRLAGVASADQLHKLLALVPPLSDGLSAALPEVAAPGDKPLRFDITCERGWHSAQTCAATPSEPVKKKRRR